MSDSQPSGSNQGPSVEPLIFVVDDEPMIGTIVELSLQMKRYRTQVFKDPTVALEAFTALEAKPDMLITDYNMPGLTGIELIRECLKVHPGLRTILLSGTVDESFLKQLTPQPQKFIAKPFFPQDLLEDVRKLLAR